MLTLNISCVHNSVSLHQLSCRSDSSAVPDDLVAVGNADVGLCVSPLFPPEPVQ